jgi:hypothetical protein
MTTTPVTLTTEAFQSALANYIDETKPDPIVKRQLESWTLTWENEETETATTIQQQQQQQQRWKTCLGTTTMITVIRIPQIFGET